MAMSKNMKPRFSIRKKALAMASERQGNAATEFSLLLPMIVMLFFGMLEGSDLLATDRRVESASTAIVDLVAQAATITPNELQDLIVGVEDMIDTDGVSSLEIKFTSVIVDPDDSSNAIVHWSLDQDLNEPYAAGATFNGISDTSILKANLSFLFAEVKYQYNGAVSGYIYKSPYTLANTASRLPRLSARVQLCKDADPNDCTT